MITWIGVAGALVTALASKDTRLGWAVLTIIAMMAWSVLAFVWATLGF